MTRKTCAILLLGCVLALSAAAQDLSPSAQEPISDGVIKDAEYGFTGTYSGMKLGAALSADRNVLYLALEVPTTGWVAIGVGSLSMNGASMVLASVANGKPVVSEQTGAGHGHRANGEKRLVASAVREANGITVLEIALPAAAYAAKNTLPLVLAYGETDSFALKHPKRASVELSMRK